MNSENQPQVPQAISEYQTAHDARDTVAALAQFTNDAVVQDNGRTYDGISEVESFLRNAASEYSYTRTVLSAVEISTNHWRITNQLNGNFPGGQVELSYDFHLYDRLISRLVIAP